MNINLLIPMSLKSSSLNLARMAQCMYQYGDEHGVVHLETKDGMKSLLIKPL
jgi:tRNA(Leu) C34 or U34 (ribose-2'-O)-methylase TrmL